MTNTNHEEYDQRMAEAMGKWLRAECDTTRVSLRDERMPKEQRDSIRRLLADGVLEVRQVVYEKDEIYHVGRGRAWPKGHVSTPVIAFIGDIDTGI